jgi:hypothetical protein
LLGGADVDEDRPLGDFVGEVFGLRALQGAACLRQQAFEVFGAGFASRKQRPKVGVRR